LTAKYFADYSVEYSLRIRIREIISYDHRYRECARNGPNRMLGP